QLFFGTPHFGSDKSQWLSIAEALGQVSAKAKGRPSTLVEAMTQNARGLTDISEDFVQIAPKYTIKTGYETKPLESTGQLVVPVMSTRMFGHQQDEVGLDADHLSMCQFSDEGDTEFEMVWKLIRQATEPEVRRPVPATVSRWDPEAEVPGQQGQENQILRIGDILGRPIYTNAPTHQQPADLVATTRNDTKGLLPIMSSHEQPLLPPPECYGLATEAEAVEVPLAVPAAHASQSLHKDMPARVVTVDRESESATKKPRWLSRMVGGMRNRGVQWR
ncbi:uncharacterized protein B0H64DRAFT_331070, partial [Chaetomium fimeti]